jgi:high affinity Mn2+ porin
LRLILAFRWTGRALPIVAFISWPMLTVAQQAAPASQPAAPASQPAAAASPSADGSGTATDQPELIVPENWAIHGQATFTPAFQPGFRSSQTGPQSLPADANGRETFDTTLYAGMRPWAGGEFWINPEIDQGFGLGNSLGVAGYLSGEAYKLGEADPYYRISRAFFRQTIDLGGEVQKVDPDLNQLGGSQTANRIVLTVGKFAVTDIFDNNKYAHDPRNDFLNWSVVDAGTFDYAADAWGVTYGASAEWYLGRYALRLGLFDTSDVPNGLHLDLPLFQEMQFVAEAEEAHTLFDQPGKLRFLYWLTRANIGTYSDALALAFATGMTPSTSAVRDYRSKYGVVLNLEQQVVTDIGFFARLGWTQQGVAEYDFTDISQTVQAGFSFGGAPWGRPDDTIGVAAVANQISRSAKEYLAAGGLGGIIGDGQLPEAGPEQLIETYYRWAVFDWAQVTTDYQFVNNPGYNRQRGPVSVLMARMHVQF